MTRLISIATGNLTAAGTWGTVDATSLLDSEAASTAVSTSNLDSSTFTPGVITCDGIALKLNARAVSPSGTFTITLRNSTGSLDVASVTVNVSDLPAALAANNDGGWVFFKFSSPQLLLGATNYIVRVVCSTTGSQVTLYRDATSNNWSRMLRTTTTGAPAAGDTMHIMGELTGAGTGNNFTVTMDQTATTDYGPGTDGSVATTVSARGTLTYGASASTNYYLKQSGDLLIYLGGTFNMGTTGTPMPSTSSAILEFDPVADGGMGLVVRGGTVTIQGNALTTTRCRLNADAAANATALTADASTGWVNNDDIVVAATSATVNTEGQTEKGQVSSTSSTTINVKSFAGTGGGLLNAHSGTSPTQAEIINLTRNIKIRSATSTIMTYVFIGGMATANIDYAEFQYLGQNGANKRGLEINSSATGADSVTVSYSSFHEFEAGGVYLAAAGGALSVVLEFCNFWNCANVSGSALTTIATPNSYKIDSNWFVGQLTTNQSCVILSDAGSTFTNNVIAGVGTTNTGIGVTLAEAAGIIGTISGNLIHHCGSIGWSQGALVGGTISTLTIYSCGNNVAGFRIGGAVSQKLVLVTLKIFGCNITGLDLGNSFGPAFIELRSPNIYGNTNGVSNGSNASLKLYIFDGSLGVTSINTGADILLAGALEVFAFNTTFASTTEFSRSNSPLGSFIRSHKNDASATTFKAFYANGSIQNDSTTRHTASGYSWKLTPVSATQKLVLPGPSGFDTFKTPVSASVLVTITVYLQKDGSYAGNAPRLVLVGGIVGGVGSAGTDVTAAMAGGSGAWEQLSVSATPNETGEVEWYVDCDGTTGNVYVDDASVTQAGAYIDTGLMDLVSRGLPAQHIAPVPASGAVRRLALTGGIIG